MRIARALHSIPLLFGLLFQINAQNAATPEPARPLVLTEAIPAPGIRGRFDHFGFDGKNQLFVGSTGQQFR